MSHQASELRPSDPSFYYYCISSNSWEKKNTNFPYFVKSTIIAGDGNKKKSKKAPPTESVLETLKSKISEFIPLQLYGRNESTKHSILKQGKRFMRLFQQMFQLEFILHSSINGFRPEIYTQML